MPTYLSHILTTEKKNKLSQQNEKSGKNTCIYQLCSVILHSLARQPCQAAGMHTAAKTAHIHCPPGAYNHKQEHSDQL
jgi:hypothetical protein